MDGELYRQRYPELPVSLEQANRNSVWRNLFVSCGPTYARAPANTDSQANHVLTGNPNIGAIAKQSVFRAIPPRTEMGPYRSPFRITDGHVR